MTIGGSLLPSSDARILQAVKTPFGTYAYLFRLLLNAGLSMEEADAIAAEFAR